MGETEQGAPERVRIYDDILEWLDMVEALGAPRDGFPMQYGLRTEVLAAEAYGIEDVFVWLGAHVTATVHCLSPRSAPGDEYILEFEDGRDSRAFAAAWGELADDWCAWDLTGGRR